MMMFVNTSVGIAEDAPAPIARSAGCAFGRAMVSVPLNEYGISVLYVSVTAAQADALAAAFAEAAALARQNTLQVDG